MSQANLDIPPNDLEPFRMPMTPNQRFKAAPEFFVEAKGMHYKTPEGRPVLDAIAGLWCVNAGHCHPRIIEAICHQAEARLRIELLARPSACVSLHQSRDGNRAEGI